MAKHYDGRDGRASGYRNALILIIVIGAASTAYTFNLSGVGDFVNTTFGLDQPAAPTVGQN